MATVKRTLGENLLTAISPSQVNTMKTVEKRKLPPGIHDTYEMARQYRARKGTDRGFK